MEHERVVQAHLARAHHNIPRRIDLGSSGRTRTGQVVGIWAFDVCDQAEPMGARYEPKATVLDRRLGQSQPDRRNLGIFNPFRVSILVPADEASARPVLIKYSRGF